MLADAGQAAAHGEVELPVRRNLEIYGWENHVALLGTRFEMRHRSGRAVVLDAGGDDRRHVPRHLRARLELRRLVRVRSFQRLRQIRIDRDIQPPLLPLEDGPDLERACVRLELAAVESHFEADAHPELEAGEI